MAKNGTKKNGQKEPSRRLKTHTKHGITGVIFFVLALFFLMAWFGTAGVAGVFFYGQIFLPLLGLGYILLPIVCLLLGYSFMKSEVPDIGWTRVFSGIMFLLSGLGVIDVASGTHGGGVLGEILAVPFVYFFEIYASLVFLAAILVISILVMFDAKLDLASLFKKVWSILRRQKEEQVSVLIE